jgi:haloacid dehalogenase superfamily, subfamily IA, variant 3 with third motif having DD or ED
LLFDFDGTIWDSETAVFRAYARLYEDHGHELPVDRWVQGVGTLDGFDPADELETLLGRDLEREAIDPWEALDEVPLRPGVREYLDQARARHLRLGIVSSNSADWIDPHLLRLGIADVWDAILAANGDVDLAKPNPQLYRDALEHLGTVPERAIAIEDSPHGIMAAKAAGLFCVACPNEVTARLDLSAADLVVGSLADLPLDELLERGELAARTPGA